MISNIIQLYSQNYTLNEIAILLGTTRYIVTKSLKKAKVPLRRLTSQCVDISFFEKIDTQEKAYVLGFIFADGCVFENRGKVSGIRIQIKKSDESVLSYIKKCMNAEHKISDVPRTDCEDQVSLVITNQKIANDLVLLGCTPRKTKTAQFPKIEQSLLPDFIRGYFDGDGGIQNSHRYYIYPSITICASETFAKTLAAYVFNITGATSRVFNSGSIWKVSWQKKSAMVFADFIYQNAEFYMERKHERYLFFKEYYQNAGYGKTWRPIRHRAWQIFKQMESQRKGNRLKVAKNI